MGRFVVNGFLLRHGYPAINLPAAKQIDFNRLMLDFYDSGDQGPMNAFLRSCLDERVITIMKECRATVALYQNHRGVAGHRLWRRCRSPHLRNYADE